MKNSYGDAQIKQEAGMVAAAIGFVWGIGMLLIARMLRHTRRRRRS